MTKPLKLHNAHENNLKGLSIEIPHDCLVTVTGLSGSGKSSLAFDTVFAEGQRRYIETFSPYTRQFFDKVKKPDVDYIENVRPAVAIEQKTRVTNSRSTVGSMTNINDYLKIIWANISRPYCKNCDSPLRAWSKESLSSLFDNFRKLKPDVRFIIAAKHELTKSLKEEIKELEEQGLSRFFDEESCKIEDLSTLKKKRRYVFLVLERFGENTFDKKRVKEAIDSAFSHSQGSCVLIEARKPSATSFLTVESKGAKRNLRRSVGIYHEFFNSYRCSEESNPIPKAKPSLFSYNHPLGACARCKGFGSVLEVDPELCVSNKNLSIKEKALLPWSGEGARGEFRRLLKFCESRGIPTDVPWREISKEEKDSIFNHKSREYIGVLPWFKRVERKIYKMHVRVFLSRFRTQKLCPDCGGTRLKPEALLFRAEGKTISEISSLQIEELITWIGSLHEKAKISGSLGRELKDLFGLFLARLKYLMDLGLPYLTLDRQARTLSGGETQRVNLTTALGSDLISTHFVLDEPSVGLHARDTRRLTEAVRALTDRGNSVLMVEHDPECILSGDHIIELGPKAGGQGGEVIYSGESALWPRERISSRRLNSKRKAGASSCLSIKKASSRNLKSFDLDIPLGLFVGVSGVSGSGKSTLIKEVILKGYERWKNKEISSVSGFEALDQVLLVDQSPLAKSPRANIGTYTGIWDTVRELFASTNGAVSRALGKSAFSFNVDGGRCPSCKGAGFIREDMQFLSDVFIPCEVCLGRRFQDSVLEVTYNGKNIHDVLALTVEDAIEFFGSNGSIKCPLETLSSLGLSHLTLGHPLSELSGGEAQRLRLVTFIEESKKRASSLLIFDEPTTGLHVRDVEALVELFISLRNRGHSILCVEHNLGLLSEADWIIDLGPEGGHRGGELLFSGTPEKLIENTRLETARFLKEFLSPPISLSKRSGAKNSKMPFSNPKHLSIKGAREHNLKNIDLEVPLGEVVAICGVSGSGKSTIAKDIIYAEGQRRYLDCLSPYARQFINELKKPEIDGIYNVKPTICVYQHTFQPGANSTVGTLSEVYNFMRLLWTKAGDQHCPDHPTEKIAAHSPEAMANEIKALEDKSVRILAPIVKLKKGFHKDVFLRAASSEISEVRVDGIFISPGAFKYDLEKGKTHSIDFTIAKFNPKTLEESLITESLKQALALGGGTVIVHTQKEERLYSSERACPVCKKGFFKPDPEDLSFSSKRGMCPKCGGKGAAKSGSVCTSCEGSRLAPIGRSVVLGGKRIHEAAKMPPFSLRKFLEGLSFDERRKRIAEPILKETLSRLLALEALGLEYLDLNRDCRSLSSGELQRLRLSASMGSPLSGVMYIFDEPSVGLHPIDNQHVISRLHALKERENSVLIIEHDPATILASDYVIDVGPGGGTDGGEIIFEGTRDEFLNSESSKTIAAIISEAPPLSAKKRSPSGPILKVENASINNLKSLSASLPLKTLVAVAGVSGAGKSSLIHGLVAESAKKIGKGAIEFSSPKGRISSSIPIDEVIFVDQKPISANVRSTPASYLGVWDDIRTLFASSIEARARGFTASFFSFNTGKGRCPACRGLGFIKLEMSFLPEASMPCEECENSRYTQDARSIIYNGINISDALALTFEEAKRIFANHRKIYSPILHACDLGLGYLTLGQSSNTLSGGESQRIKLVSELEKPLRGHNLYLLDEPTTGLHRSDIEKLMKSLRRLVDKGHSVFIIEHDDLVLRGSDWIVELGPGAGERGGNVIFSGPPAEILKAKTPWGDLLREDRLGAVRSGFHGTSLPSSVHAQ